MKYSLRTEAPEIDETPAGHPALVRPRGEGVGSRGRERRGRVGGPAIYTGVRGGGNAIAGNIEREASRAVRHLNN